MHIDVIESFLLEMDLVRVLPPTRKRRLWCCSCTYPDNDIKAL